jgi:hypothetical protein
MMITIKNMKENDKRKEAKCEGDELRGGGGVGWKEERKKDRKVQ